MISNNNEPYTFIPPSSTDILTTPPVDAPGVMFPNIDPILPHQLDAIIGMHPVYQQAITEHGPLFRQFMLSHVSLKGTSSRITLSNLQYYQTYAANSDGFYNSWKSCCKILKWHYKQFYLSSPNQTYTTTISSDYIALPPTESLQELSFFSCFNIDNSFIIFLMTIFYFMIYIFKPLKSDKTQ